MEQKPSQNKSFDEAFLDYLLWVNANTFGKVRKIVDAFEYSVGWTGTHGYHPETDAIKNVSTSDYAIAISMNNSLTNMLLNYDLLKSGQYSMVGSFKEYRLGTPITTNTVANLGTSPYTGQSIEFSGLSTSTHYVVYIPTNKLSKVEITNATLINNTEVLLTDGMPIGYTGLMFKPTLGTVTIKLNVATGVGLAVMSNNTQVKLFPVTVWNPQECKMWICSNK